jgi:hypothetical protein
VGFDDRPRLGALKGGPEANIDHGLAVPPGVMGAAGVDAHRRYGALLGT